jgi:hypothetical protein
MTPTTTLRNFKSLTKFTYVGLPLNMREQLTANRTYYVRTDGSNSNNGLANTSGGAFLTIQKAIDVVCETIDIGGYQVTIKVGNGTYTSSVTLKQHNSSRAVKIEGDTATPGNVIISTTGSSIRMGYAADLMDAYVPTSPWWISGMRVQSSTSEGLEINCGELTISEFSFGTCAGNHITAWASSTLYVKGAITIVGGASHHIQSARTGNIIGLSGATTLTGNPAFTRFVYVDSCGVVEWSGRTFSGTATGARYIAAGNGVISTLGAGANYFPGSTAGTTQTGGQYL